RRARGHRSADGGAPVRARARNRTGAPRRARGLPRCTRATPRRARPRELLADPLARGRSAERDQPPGPARPEGTGTARDDDRRAPRLADGQRAARDYVATLDVTLDAEQLMAQARDRARCDDFGDLGFRARLDAMLAAVEADTGLGPIGRLAVQQRTVRLLT